MSDASYDAIVVGARCAGSPTAMLLARKGYRVLLVDKATFPSDTMSTHMVHPPGLAALERWGLLERLEATGCPPVETYSFDFGPVTIAGSPRPIDGIAHGYCPRRTVLDKLLVDAAVEAGAELREGFTVDEILATDGTVTGIRGHAKGGPDGHRARAGRGRRRWQALTRGEGGASPSSTTSGPSHMAMYYAYWSGLPARASTPSSAAEDRRGWAAISTHDDLTVLPFGWPVEEFHANRGDIEGNFFATMDLAPEFGERVRGGEAGVEVRRLRRAARLLPQAIRAGLGAGRRRRLPQEPDHGDGHQRRLPRRRAGRRRAGRRVLRPALIRRRDERIPARRVTSEAMPVYEFTDEFAQLEPPPPEMQQLIGAMHGNQEAMDGFVSVQANTLPAPEFFAPENVGQIMAQAGVGP